MGGIRGTKVLNGTDESFAMYSKIPSDKTIVFNGEGNSMWLTDVQATNESASATLHAANGAHRLRLSIPGTFNLENAMCAIGCTTNLGIPLESALQSLTTFKSLPGRLERIDEGQPFSVFVDFAVSPQSYERTLETLRKIVGDSGRVLVLCCSCGNRMEEKRVVVGQVCSKLADIVVATEDETYGEDPHKVLDEVWAGIDQTQTDAHKIFDRREAITFLFNNAEPGDAVALCGMGPFSTFTRLEGRVEWDEREVARELLREL
jgi:UDP-N-acetylmuramoyl-L-alanyl-D-glutamate--2,6-diaminopimelate ligase